jgi:fumarate hydratase subunit beta
MDVYTPRLLELGLAAMIGKGARSAEVTLAMKSRGAVYFAATGGAGALLRERIESCETVAFPELGAEAVHKLFVRDFPVVVAIDSRGECVYDAGRAAYLAGDARQGCNNL